MGSIKGGEFVDQLRNCQILKLVWDWAHLVRRPLIGLLYQPRMIVDKCGAVDRMRIGRGTEVLGENLPQCHFVHHKSYMTWPGLEPGPPRSQDGLYSFINLIGRLLFDRILP
jgi:hypothetical protein